MSPQASLGLRLSSPSSHRPPITSPLSRKLFFSRIHSHIIIFFPHLIPFFLISRIQSCKSHQHRSSAILTPSPFFSSHLISLSSSLISSRHLSLRPSTHFFFYFLSPGFPWVNFNIPPGIPGYNFPPRASSRANLKFSPGIPGLTTSPSSRHNLPFPS